MSDGNKLEIELHLNRDKAKAQAQAFRGDMAKLNKDILSDAEAATDRETAAHKAATGEREKINRDLAGRFIAKGKEVEAAQRDALRRVTIAHKQAAAEQAAAQENVAGAIEKSVKGVLSLGVGLTGLGSASAAIGVVIGHFKEVNKAIYDAGQFVQNYRKALQELAALKGNLGNTTKELGENLDFRTKTLQSAEDAKAFQAAALGVGESAVDKPGKPALISPTEFTRAMELGGGFQAAEGGSADTHGTLVGLIPGLLGRRTTGEEVARKEAQLYKVFQPGGASFTSLSNQYAKSAAPLISAKTLDPMQAAATLSAFSTTNKEGAGTELEQFVRATTGGIDKTGKPRVEEGTPIGAYLKTLGVTPDFLKQTKSTDIPFAIADRIKGDLLAQEQASKARGEEFSRAVYLKHKGFANQEETAALSHYIGLSETGQMKTFMDLASPGALPSLDEARKPVMEAQRTDPLMQGRKAELSDEAAKVAIGAGKPEFLTNLQRVAFNRLKTKGEVVGDYTEDIQNRWNLDPRGMVARRNTELESQRMLAAEAKRVGVPFTIPRSSRTEVTGTKTDLGEQYVGNDALYDLAKKIQAKGGTAIPGLDTVNQAAQKTLRGAQQFEGNDPGQAGDPVAHKLLEKQNELLQKLVDKNPAPGPQPRQGIPPVPNVNPAARRR
jgi:hypothetical protein